MNDCTSTVARGKVDCRPVLAFSRNKKNVHAETPDPAADRIRECGGCVSEKTEAETFHGSGRPRKTTGNHLGKPCSGPSTPSRCASVQRATGAISAAQSSQNRPGSARQHG